MVRCRNCVEAAECFHLRCTITYCIYPDHMTTPIPSPVSSRFRESVEIGSGMKSDLELQFRLSSMLRVGRWHRGGGHSRFSEAPDSYQPPAGSPCFPTDSPTRARRRVSVICHHVTVIVKSKFRKHRSTAPVSARLDFDPSPCIPGSGGLGGRRK